MLTCGIPGISRRGTGEDHIIGGHGKKLNGQKYGRMNSHKTRSEGPMGAKILRNNSLEYSDSSTFPIKKKKKAFRKTEASP